jgi:membrane protease YdiL (CAAX protease family)
MIRMTVVDAAAPSEGKGRPRRGWLEVLSWGVLYVGYDVVMVMAYHFMMGIPRRTVPWLEAFTAAAVIRDYAPEVIGTAFLIGVIAVFHRWRDAAITTEPKASLWGILPLLAYVAVVVAFAPLASQSRSSTVFSVVWIGVLIGAFNEEVVMRGVLLGGMARRWGPARAAWLTTLLFGAAHLSGLWTGHSFVDLHEVLWTATLHGAVYAKVRLATGSLWCSVLLHALTNFTIYLTAYGPSLGRTTFRAVNRASLIVGGVLLAHFIASDVVTTWRARRRVTTAPADPDTYGRTAEAPA